MRFIQNTLIRKKMAELEVPCSTSYKKYMASVKRAREAGFSDGEIIIELESERERIESDTRNEDATEPLLLAGTKNAKTSCINAINLIIQELKGETDDPSQN